LAENMRMRSGSTRLVGDDLKAQHPDYFQLLRDDPRSAGAAIVCCSLSSHRAPEA
jgi:hypothetical protein